MGKVLLKSYKELKNKSSEELASSTVYANRDKNGWKARAVKNGFASETSSVSEDTSTQPTRKLESAPAKFVFKQSDFPTLEQASARKFKP